MSVREKCHGGYPIQFHDNPTHINYVYLPELVLGPALAAAESHSVQCYAAAPAAEHTAAVVAAPPVVAAAAVYYFHTLG